jgi:hypothetical protein
MTVGEEKDVLSSWIIENDESSNDAGYPTAES